MTLLLIDHHMINNNNSNTYNNDNRNLDFWMRSPKKCDNNRRYRKIF